MTRTTKTIRKIDGKRARKTVDQARKAQRVAKYAAQGRISRKG